MSSLLREEEDVDLQNSALIIVIVAGLLFIATYMLAFTFIAVFLSVRLERKTIRAELDAVYEEITPTFELWWSSGGEEDVQSIIRRTTNQRQLEQTDDPAEKMHYFIRKMVFTSGPSFKEIIRNTIFESTIKERMEQRVATTRKLSLKRAILTRYIHARNAHGSDDEMYISLGVSPDAIRDAFFSSQR